MEIKIPRANKGMLSGLLNKANGGFYDFLGENIKKLRLYKGLTQRCVANHLGISYQQYQKYERGQNRISVQFIIKLMDLFKVDIYEILGQRNPNEHIIKEIEGLKNRNTEMQESLENSNEQITILKNSNSDLRTELKHLYDILDKKIDKI